MAKLTKLSDDAFDGKHPNGINAGYTKEVTQGIVPVAKVGECFYFGSLRTSTVTRVLADARGFTFNTLNSTYRVDYD